MKEIIIYTDGACRGNPGPGAWACLLQYGSHEKKHSGYEAHTTNNQMELRATIEALNLLNERCTVNLYTDSKYVQQGITEWIHKWKKNQWKTSAKKTC
jgi:RNase HI (EC 3.1.26.4)